MPTAALNGTTIWYDIEGEGDPCLVLHGGLGLDHSCYRAPLRPLATRLQLLYFDQRGNGRSARPPLETITMEQLADDAAALAEHLGFARVHVLGHSYGGFVAQELALRHPDLVRSLVLLATTPGQLGTTEHADDEQGEPPPLELAEALSTAPATDDEMRETFRRIAKFYVHQSDPNAACAVFDEVIFDVAAMTRGFEVLAGWTSVDRLHTITAPTLVAVGRYDVFTSSPQSTRIASRVPGAQLVVFDDSGHLLFLDEPERFAALLTGWFAGEMFQKHGRRSDVTASER